MAERAPLGSEVLHVGSDKFVANAGAVVYGGPAQGDPGRSFAGGGWATTPIGFPPSPDVGSLQVAPISYEPNHDLGYPANGAREAWMGNLGAPHSWTKIGKSPDDADETDG